MSKKLEIEKMSDDKEYEQLLRQIMERSREGVEKAADEVRKAQLETYWDNGRYIVEYEQNGKKHAEYGLELLKKLAADLTLRLGKGYSRPTLYKMRKFYQCYPKGYDECKALSWSHICELIYIDDDLERSFYAKQCTAEKWNVRTLKRQKKSALFLRLAASTDKQGILKLAEKGIEIQTAEDVVKDTYTLEFLNLSETSHYNEKDLESRILDHLQEFLLELGKCFVLIDLKKDDVQHDDIGQMNTYMGYIAEEENMSDDNPPIGIILARGKDELLVK